MSDFSKLMKQHDILTEKFNYLLKELKSASGDSLAATTILDNFQKEFSLNESLEEAEIYRHVCFFNIRVDIEATQRFDEDYLYDHLIDKFYGYDEMIPPASLLGSEIDAITHFDIDCVANECKVETDEA